MERVRTFAELVNNVKGRYYSKPKKQKTYIYHLLQILSADEDKTEWINLGYFSNRGLAEEAWEAYQSRHDDATDYSIREYAVDSDDCWRK